MVPRLATLVGAIALAVTVWLWQRRDGEPQVVPSAAAGQAEAPGRRPAADPVSPAAAPVVEPDDDPVGALRLTGRVTDPAGVPVAGATVVLGSVPQRTAVTDAAGAFAFAGLAGRAYAVWARAGERVGGPFTLSPAEGVQVVVGRGATLAIEVADAGGGPAPAGAVVQLHGGAELRGGAVLEIEAPGGQARLVGVEPGRLEVIAAAPGREGTIEPVAVPPRSSNPLAVKLAVKATRAQPDGGVRVPAGALRLAGRVVGSGGAPAPWAVVRVMPASSKQHRVRDLLADEQGRFAIDELPATTLLIMARTEQASSAAISVDLGRPPPPRDLSVPLISAGVLAGRVTDAAGAPIAGAEISAEPQVWGDQGPAALLFGPPAARSGPGGEFALTGLPSGIWRLTAQVPGHPGPPLLGRAVTGDDDLRLVLGGAAPAAAPR